MDIIIDERENKLKTLLQKFSYVTTRTLDIADVHIQIDGTTVLLIERKTNDDLRSSLLDGRYKEQKNRLLNTGIPVLYILEGESLLFKRQNEDTNVTLDKSLQTIELDLGLNKHTKLLRTKNVEETALYLQFCGQYFQNNTHNTEKVATAEDFLCMKKSKCINSDNMLKIMLCQIPGVSINTANSLSNHFHGSSHRFFCSLDDPNQFITEISNIKLNKKKIGRISAQKIVGYLTKSK